MGPIMRPHAMIQNPIHNSLQELFEGVTAIVPPGDQYYVHIECQVITRLGKLCMRPWPHAHGHAWIRIYSPNI